MQFLGASQNELLFVAFMIALVLVAPKVPKFGEWVGGFFEKRPPEKSIPPPSSKRDPSKSKP